MKSSKYFRMADNTQPDYVVQAVEYILKRDEDGNFFNEGLNEIEGELFLKIQEGKYNCAVGESIENAFNKELMMELAITISRVTRKFGIK